MSQINQTNAIIRISKKIDCNFAFQFQGCRWGQVKESKLNDTFPILCTCEGKQTPFNLDSLIVQQVN